MAAPREYYEYDGPPPGPGYYASHPQSQGYDDRGRHARGQQHDQQRASQPYFDPPPREAYPDDTPYDSRGAPSRDYQHGEYGPPPTDGYGYGEADMEQGYPETEAGRGRDPPRPYAPTEPGPHEFNAVAPYDEEKAEAEWRRGVEDAYTYQRGPPPSAGPPRDLRPRNDRREYDYDDDPYEDRERDRERRRGYEDRGYDERAREKERDRRRRDEEEYMKEKALRYPSDPKKGGRDFLGGSEGERGMGAKLIGGAAGALLGHETKGNALGTIGGALVGAIGATAVEKHLEQRKNEKVYGRRESHDAYADKYGPAVRGKGEVAYPAPGRHMDDVRRSGKDGSRDDYPRQGGRSGSRGGGGIRERLRSLSRAARSRSRPRRRRSDSYDSEDEHGR